MAQYNCVTGQRVGVQFELVYTSISSRHQYPISPCNRGTFAQVEKEVVVVCSRDMRVLIPPSLYMCSFSALVQDWISISYSRFHVYIRVCPHH